jgi:enoyl-CoA hydratase
MSKKATTMSAPVESPLLEVDQHIALITLNRPDRRNALDRPTIDRLTQLLDDLGGDDDVRAVIITGQDPAFCAGLDLDNLAQDATLLDRRLVDAIGRLDKPLIGAINGATVTGGLEIALACDVLIASERATFRDTHTLVGVLPSWGMSAKLQGVVGRGWARRISLTAVPISAKVAERIGLVTEVVSHGELLPAAQALAAAISDVDQGAMRAIRRLYTELQGLPLADAMRIELERHQAYTRPDRTELAQRRQDILR